jgi:uncharacterized protein
VEQAGLGLGAAPGDTVNDNVIFLPLVVGSWNQENLTYLKKEEKMNCPVCNIALNLSERQGVEIDYCPQCRGVWLDRGELDKIIDKSSSIAEFQRREPEIQTPQPSREFSYQPQYRNDHHYDSHGKKKHKSFLSDLFD